MDKYEEKEMLKKRLLAKYTWSDWLITYIYFQTIKNSG